MSDERFYEAAAMFEGDYNIWWISGGEDADYNWLDTTEVYNAVDNSFSFGADLPKELFTTWSMSIILTWFYLEEKILQRTYIYLIGRNCRIKLSGILRSY